MTFYLTVFDGTSYAYSSVNVTVNTPPTVSLSPSGSINVDNGDSVLLTANVSNQVQSVTWFNGSNIIAQGISTQLWVNDSGTYYVVVNNADCQATSESINVQFIYPLSVNIIVTPDTVVCAGSFTEPYASALGGSGNYSYQWSTGDTTTSVFLYPQTSGKYYVTVSDGISSVADSIYIKVLPAPFCPHYSSMDHCPYLMD